MPLILAIESTCDETAASVVRDGVDVRSNVIATQYELHAKFRGVVPEIASRAHVENILPVIREATEQAGMTFADLDAIAVAYRPGLIGSLLVGVTAAKTLAWSLGKPLIGVDHVHAHLYSVMLAPMPRDRKAIGLVTPNASSLTGQSPTFPAVGLVCSGGHTALYRLNGWLDVTLIGSTIDDAVGEAYDKVAAILGLPFPGGPTIDALAAEGDPRAVAFPRAMLDRDSLDFSFSGLKTSVLYHVRGFKGREREASVALAAGVARRMRELSRGVHRHAGQEDPACARSDRRAKRCRRRRGVGQPRAAGRARDARRADSPSRPRLLHRQRRDERRPCEPVFRHRAFRFARSRSRDVQPVRRSMTRDKESRTK